MKLNDRQKALLTPEAITRIEAGFITLETGKLTDDGRGAMWLILTDKFGKEFSKLAEKAVAEQTQAEMLSNAKAIIANS